MKKDYVKPNLEVTITAICENLLQSSYVDIGGTTDRFNARHFESHGIWDEGEEGDEFAQ